MAKSGNAKVIVAGPRDATFQNLVWATLDERVPRTATLVLGGASGVDELARQWADYWNVKTVIYKADWEKHGRAAGPIRNREMAAAGTALIAFQYHGFHTPGTQSMIREAKRRNIPIEIITVHRVEKKEDSA